MDVEFGDKNLDRLEIDSAFTMGLDQALVKAYRKRLQVIRNAPDERDFYKLQSWRFEKLDGKRQNQHSIRLNDQFRLIIEFVGTGRDKCVRIVGIGDYH